MDVNSLPNIKRLEEQIFHYKPSIKSAERKKYVSDRLQNQLLHSKAVVKIQRMDAECESLMISLKQRLMQLQDFLIPKNKELSARTTQKSLKNKDEKKLTLSSDSSDDEMLSSIVSKSKTDDGSTLKDEEAAETQRVDTTESPENCLPLALRRQPRERRLSYKSYSSSSTSYSKASRKKVVKQQQSVTTSGVSFSSEEILVEQEVDATPTIHIKIPSLHRGNVHYIILDSLNFARKVFDYRANEVKQQQDKKSILESSKTPKSRKKSIKCASAASLQQLAHQEQELQLSQLIQDVMAEACSDETLQATNALENINNNVIDNYDLVENDSFANCSQSSQEFSFSQSSNVIAEPICSISKGANSHKKQRKNTKRSNECKQNEPPKKRGRRPKQKNISEPIQSQPPTKSNLAQYVELFSNDCELLPGSTTPAASSTKSQHLVSSTTHNYEVVDQLQQQQEQQTSSEPITYYFEGDWANGGPCQLITSNAVTVEGRQDNTSAPFQEYVNYIDTANTSDNNVIATVLECNHSLPISIPRSIANFAFQNKNPQPAANQNSLLPIINIQIPPLPNTISSTTEPPPAHTHKEVVDLSVKCKRSTTVATEPLKNLDKNSLGVDDDDCMPLDLSSGGKFVKEKILENNLVTIDTQDEEFIRRLIEQNDFEFRHEEMKKGSDNEILVYDQDNNKSFKAALDMPLIEFDASELAKLVESTTNTSSQEQSILTDNIVYNDSTNNEDSNYVSMDAINSSIDDNLHFANQSTTELFNKLLDIRPDNPFLNEVNSEYLVADDLDQSVFDQCRMENSTMCELQNFAQKEYKEEVCDKSSTRDTQEKENTSSDQPSSSNSLVPAVQLDISESNKEVVSLSTESISDKHYSKIELNLKGPQCLTNYEKENESDIEESQQATTTESDNTKEKENEANAVNKGADAISLCHSDNIDNLEVISICNPTAASNDTDHQIKPEDSQQTNAKDDTTENVLNTSQTKYKDNVVFSVSKISLSEDDNLYVTDSDSSNDRSCDLNERKPIETKNDVLKDSTESVYKNDFNLYNKKEEKLQNVESNIEQDLPSTSNRSECNEVKESKREIGERAAADLTLLELESKLEASLDFDEDFDDALSLATSCFDSPNDERFEDSIVDDIDVKTQPEPAIELEETKLASNPSQVMDLTHFKIPKLSNATDTSSTDTLNKPEQEEIKLFNISPAKHSGKITRTVKNNLVLDLKADTTEVLAEKDFVNETTIEEKVMLNVFGISCFPYLVDKCFDKTHYQLSHRLNDVEKATQSLNSLDKAQASAAYRIMYNHAKLFEVYFKQFCIYYTKKNDRTKLLNMVNDCERYPECAEQIIDIYEGLVKCGLSRINACRLVLKRIRETSIATSIVNALIAMIMKSDWVMFTDFIEKYTQDIFQYNFRIGILEQMAPAILNSKSSHLKQVFGKCVQTLHRDDTALLLNSPTLIQCVALLTTNT